MKAQNIIPVWVLKSQRENKLPIMQRVPKMHKKHNCTFARFNIMHVSSLNLKYALTKQISKSASDVFKLAYSQIRDFQKNAKFLLNYHKS